MDPNMLKQRFVPEAGHSLISYFSQLQASSKALYHMLPVHVTLNIIGD